MKKKIFLFTGIVLMFTALPVLLSAQRSRDVPQEKEVRLRYLSMTDGSAYAAENIYFSCWDEKTGRWASQTTVTDEEGYAVFTVPVNKKGLSLPFLYSMSESMHSTQMGIADQGMNPCTASRQTAVSSTWKYGSTGRTKMPRSKTAASKRFQSPELWISCFSRSVWYVAKILERGIGGIFYDQVISNIIRNRN